MKCEMGTMHHDQFYAWSCDTGSMIDACDLRLIKVRDEHPNKVYQDWAKKALEAKRPIVI